MPLKTNGPKTNVLPENKYDGPVVIYKDGVFSPPVIQLKTSTSDMGCLLKISNDSGSPLVIRLGPYDMSLKENYGRKYPEVPAGKSMVIDPRFGRKKEEFINLASPAEKFLMEIDESCLPK